tara:strand:- start:1071 stop:1514 length:444 start_codon:yes stop_codon:yes gene_type:complete
MNIASVEALKSTQNFKHGAVITGKGGKVLCSGYNKGNRSKVLDSIFTCVHAEMDVINKFVNGTLRPKYGRNFLKHTKKYNIWVVRLQNTEDIKYTMSKPCFYCCLLLKKYGFFKVYYTLDEHTIQCMKISELDSNHKSKCQLKMENL